MRGLALTPSGALVILRRMGVDAAKLLESWRKRQGLSQLVAATIVGVEQPTWSRWESNALRPEGLMRAAVRLVTARNPLPATPNGIAEDAWNSDVDRAELAVIGARAEALIPSVPAGPRSVYEWVAARRTVGATMAEVELGLSLPSPIAAKLIRGLSSTGCLVSTRETRAGARVTVWRRGRPFAGTMVSRRVVDGASCPRRVTR